MLTWMGESSEGLSPEKRKAGKYWEQKKLHLPGRAHKLASHEFGKKKQGSFWWEEKPKGIK